MSGEREAPQVPHVLEIVQAPAGEAVLRILAEPETQDVAPNRRDLRPDEHQHALVDPLEGLCLDVVVVGDRHEVEAHGTGGPNHLFRGAAPVRQGGVDVHDAARPDVAVCRGLADGFLEGRPEGEAERVDARQHEGGQQ